MIRASDRFALKILKDLHDQNTAVAIASCSHCQPTGECEGISHAVSSFVFRCKGPPSLMAFAEKKWFRNSTTIYYICIGSTLVQQLQPKSDHQSACLQPGYSSQVWMGWLSRYDLMLKSSSTAVGVSTQVIGSGWDPSSYPFGIS